METKEYREEISTLKRENWEWKMWAVVNLMIAIFVTLAAIVRFEL